MAQHRLLLLLLQLELSQSLLLALLNLCTNHGSPLLAILDALDLTLLVHPQRLQSLKLHRHVDPALVFGLLG